MAVLDLVAAAAREIVVRTIEVQARQEATPTSDAPSASTTSTESSRTATTSERSTGVSTATASASPTDGDFGQRRDSTTSPLLFFVALGFGVVFTNLWIIVGVKYCFRYNARNRQLRMAEEGDPVALENMPRPHRRRREKKLMTMDEVNEKFPMQKYKNWVSARAQEGLPTRGGIAPSRANSVRSVEGIAPEPPSKERASGDERPSTSHSARNEPAATATPKATSAKDNKKDVLPETTDETGQSSSTATAAAPATPTTAAAAPAATATGADGRRSLERVESEDDNDDDHINAALPPECMGTSGDACAICIETLEDDDDVRGLTCGHAFHAVCLDPWLTSRRACCPLCKADYYTPKPRPPPADGSSRDANGAASGNATFGDMGHGTSRINMPSGPQGAWLSLTRSRRWWMPGSAQQQQQQQQQQASTRARDARSRRARRAPAPASPADQHAAAQQQHTTLTTTSSTPAETPGHAIMSTLRNPFRRIQAPNMPRLRFGRQAGAEQAAPTSEPAAPAVTPSQLEAGTRPAAAATPAA